MQKGFLLSAVLHIGTLALLVFGVPDRPDELLENQQPIPVEIMEIAAETMVTKEVAAPKPEVQTEEAPTEQAKAPEPPPEPVEEEVVEEIKLPEPEPKVKEVKNPEPQPAPKPQVKPIQIAQKVQDVPQHQAFTSVLKNLKNKKKVVTSEAQLDSQNELDKPLHGKIGSKLTMSELDAVRQQMARCWNIPAGLKDAYNMVVEIEVQANPDGTVQGAKIVNRNKMSNPQFRTAAESARRAVLNPKCQPLKLPKDKYAQWKVFSFRFNPKDLL